MLRDQRMESGIFGVKNMTIRRETGMLVLIIFLLFSHASAADEQPPTSEIRTGSITGTVMISGAGPLAGGQVLLYDVASGIPPAPSKYERTPDITKDIDADGRFRVDIRPGRYYLSAIKRSSGARIGPPETGDYVFRSLDEKGNPREYLIEAGSSLDIGTVSAAPLKPERLSDKNAATAIEGFVKEKDGMPVADAVVAAFVTTAMQGKPLFISGKTGSDGAYVLRVAPGTYYLRARNASASGPPQAGHIMGFYGQGGPAPVTIKEGERKKGMDINAVRFPGRGPLAPAGPKK